jgi:ferredoxin-NADP reductase
MDKLRYILKDKREEADDIMSLILSPQKGGNLPFTPGQFVNIYLHENGQFFGKSYSISSTPGDNFLQITVKKIGNFSTKLFNLPIKTEVLVEGPFGYFYPENWSKNLVFLAGGIGISPFYSIVKSALTKNTKFPKITLFYSVGKFKDAAFYRDLHKISELNDSVNIIYFLTRQTELTDQSIECELKHIDVNSLKKHLTNLQDADYYICGPIGFVNDMWKTLKENEVNEDRIFTEAFY